jgi:hypothetical protein
MTAYLDARLNARPLSTGCRIRAVTSRRVPVVQERRKIFGCATLSEPLGDTVLALG